MYYIFATCCPCRITRECLQDREREIDRGRLRPTLGVVSSAHELCTKATLRMPLPSPCHLYYLRWIHLHTLSSDDRQHNQRTDARFATSMMTRERGRVVHEESEIDDDDDDDTGHACKRTKGTAISRNHEHQKPGAWYYYVLLARSRQTKHAWAWTLDCNAIACIATKMWP